MNLPKTRLDVSDHTRPTAGMIITLEKKRESLNIFNLWLGLKTCLML